MQFPCIHVDGGQNARHQPIYQRLEWVGSRCHRPHGIGHECLPICDQAVRNICRVSIEVCSRVLTIEQHRQIHDVWAGGREIREQAGDRAINVNLRLSEIEKGQVGKRVDCCCGGVRSWRASGGTAPHCSFDRQTCGPTPGHHLRQGRGAGATHFIHGTVKAQVSGALPVCPRPPRPCRVCLSESGAPCATSAHRAASGQTLSVCVPPCGSSKGPGNGLSALRGLPK